MLQAPGRRTAKGESERGDQRAFRAPAAIEKQHHQSQPAEREHAESDGVEGYERRRAIKQSQQEMRRRENQRLRIGDLRMAAKDVGRPERRLARVQRAGEKRQLRIKMRLGVPWNGECAREPGPGEQQGASQKQRKRRSVI